MEKLKENLVVYGAEALGLALFMISAGVFSVVLFGSGSPATGWHGLLKLAAMGAAMGATAVAIFRSPFGKLSGAHINPAVTLAFWKLGKIRSVDALGYVVAQFAGAVVGVAAAQLLLGRALAEPAVNFAVTVPGATGAAAAFAAEFGISFLMFGSVLATSNHSRLARTTPYVAGSLVAAFILFESPVSGMSMNPARSFGSAVFGGGFDSLWIYFAAPPLAMLAAAEAFKKLRGPHSVLCAKLDHDSRYRCIFDCRSLGSER